MKSKKAVPVLNTPPISSASEAVTYLSGFIAGRRSMGAKGVALMQSPRGEVHPSLVFESEKALNREVDACGDMLKSFAPSLH